MGQSGYLTLVNSTDTAWRKTYQHSYQMNIWDFPNVIAAQTSISVYIEWNQHFFNDSSDDAGEVVYSLEGTSDFFEIQASATSGFDIKVYFANLKIYSNQNEALFSLGWQRKGYVSFILSGMQGKYSSTNLNGSSWMQDNISILGTKELSEICMLGARHAGMNVRTSNTFGASDCNVITQTRNIREQLQLGVRYLDIQPVLRNGDFFTGNYHKIEAISMWRGATGQSIDHVIEDVNTFIAVRKELVIIKLSNSLHTYTDNGNYRAFNKSEWNSLLKKMSGINYLYCSLPTIDLAVKTVHDFISERPAVFILVEGVNNLGSFDGKGFFKESCFNMYKKQSNTNNTLKMAIDQLQSMRAYKDEYFLLSWIVKQNAVQAAMCFLEVASGIKKLANKANQQLPNLMYSKITHSTFPNMIILDNILTSEAAAFAMAINWKIHTVKKTNDTFNNVEKITN
ncbi:hypothetical protein KORDIASMS9_02060 [Kordia sp. SMS9]|uniref:hypothetical protein n=1 Tax=Kordia sp. SMS9 TaxID=2282170 RepID=UPI000E0DC0A8|nr:hypothetical protein [Kordia sp. SMS9]AXG69832.1 hypothetical protein KORDIASMS9_02060 [Kordia sp. SMS9]